ncbi:Inherit from fuNOG: protein-lysine N-methyltransferase activity [Seminavis robusta]|uniref:Inherit from fuNOG: protein-lysine N-methyltransferase activity n=1 Tax=Seminavis robusta TaxID=568900 RepID=A0A9N8EGP1_9STRA|nr:Inherit from fuNOG: protein-lysine N-methyltransferase activity [Seminavis robusta]|eukprot:Sro1136_g245130.1 Inherit from fuNOG: protein-lysine N-methyltransferase activity (360) ;mRNA; r:5986-7177
MTACFVLSSSPSKTITQHSTQLFSSSGLVDIQAISRDTPGSSYDLLLDWLRAKGATVNDNLCFQPSSRGGGYGAFVTDNVAKGEILVEIPRSACVTLDNVKNDPDSGEVFQKLMTQAGPGGNTVALAGILAKKRLVALAKGSEAIEYGPYFDTLPWERGINSQEHMLFWSDEDVDTFMKGTMCYSEAKSLREEVDLAISVLNKIIGKSILTARGELSETDSGFNFPWDPKPEPLKQIIDGLPEAVRGAFVCLLTRAFQDGDDDDEDAEKLVPWLDMLQHSDEPNIRHAMRKDDGTVEVRAGRDLQAGEELFNQYRSEKDETMPYHRFFTRYGFVPGIEENIADLLKDKSSIFVAQKAEV